MNGPYSNKENDKRSYVLTLVPSYYKVVRTKQIYRREFGKQPKHIKMFDSPRGNGAYVEFE